MIGEYMAALLVEGELIVVRNMLAAREHIEHKKAIFFFVFFALFRGYKNRCKGLPKLPSTTNIGRSNYVRLV